MNIDNLASRAREDPHNALLRLELARGYLCAGEESKARDLVLRHRNSPTGDFSIHRGWGEICHALGMARQAEESYGRALKEKPGDGETLYRLGLLLSETGHYEKAIDILRRTLKHAPEHAKTRALLADVYRELGLSGQAEALSPEPPGEKPPSPLRYFPPSVSQRDTATFLRLFSGREVGYAEQQVSPADGKIHFVHHDAPLDHECIRAHILGVRTFAVYPLRSDTTVHFAAVSVHLPAGLLEANLKSRGYISLLEEKMKRYTVLLAQFATGLGLAAYPEYTGDHAFRLFFFFETFIHLLKAKKFLSEFLEAAPGPESPFFTEPLLATRPAGVGWIEHPLLLPLGVHRATLGRSLFLDPHGGTLCGEQLKLLRKMRPVRPDAAHRILRGMASTGPEKMLLRRACSPRAESLIRKCATLKELVRRSFAGRNLRREEKLVLFYTVGLLDREGKDLHELLHACPDYDLEKVSRQAARLKSHPVSCLKIRELIPEITSSVRCDCMFDLRGGKYPSPLLHVLPQLVPEAEAFPVPEDLPLKDAARRCARLLQHRGEIESAMNKLLALIERKARHAGIDCIKLDAGVLRRIEQDGAARWILEVS